MIGRESICEEQLHLAEGELVSFLAAVTELYGPGQARLSAEGWLDESEIMDSPPRYDTWQTIAVIIVSCHDLFLKIALHSTVGSHSSNRMGGLEIRRILHLQRFRYRGETPRLADYLVASRPP